MTPRERPRVVVAGGGVAALEATLALRELAGPRPRLTLLAAEPRFEYAPLAVAEPFGLGRAHRVDLASLLSGRDVELRAGRLAAVDPRRARAATAEGEELEYDALLIAIGARRQRALPGAVTFAGASAAAEVARLLRAAARGALERLAFAVPTGVTWSLPAYELALMSAAWLEERGAGTSVALVTPEPRPIDAFGARAADAVAEMLRLRGVAFHSASPREVEPGRLLLAGEPPLPADAVVALPRLVARQIAGLPADERGFIPVDAHGRVAGLEAVYAAGDVTDFPLKQGGLAAQQAEAAAEAIAAELGEHRDLRPFRPRLRGLLLTGPAPRHLRAELIGAGAGPDEPAGEDDSGPVAIRWLPAKIAGRRLGPVLARHGVPGGPPPGALALELEAEGGPAGT